MIANKVKNQVSHFIDIEKQRIYTKVLKWFHRYSISAKLMHYWSFEDENWKG